MKSSKMNNIGVFLIIGFLALALISGGCTSTPSTITVTTTMTTDNPVTTTLPTSAFATTLTTTVTTKDSSTSQIDFISSASRVLPSVVVIEDQITTTDRFGRNQTGSAAGTGWILNGNGIIVTNAHVVYQATNIQITLSDGRVYPATTVKTDLNNDLAVIKIDATGLQAVSIGDSSNLKMGQWVAAIGNSLDLGVRITGGLVSRLNDTGSYSITSSVTVSFNDLIETDATINPGNSGGVLIDLSGNVIGITNSGISGPSTDLVGFGYAIPINSAIPNINALVSQLQ